MKVAINASAGPTNSQPLTSKRGLSRRGEIADMGHRSGRAGLSGSFRRSGRPGREEVPSHKNAGRRRSSVNLVEEDDAGWGREADGIGRPPLRRY